MEVLNTTKITMAWELFEAGMPKRHIASKLGLHWETVGIWIQGIKDNGLLEFLYIYTSAKKGPRVKRQVDPILKRWVWEIRERESDCCGQKILYFLEKEHGVKISVPKIYEILAEKYKIKSKWKKNQIRGPVPHATKPREVIQMDTVDFGEVFAFTGIDIFTKEVEVKLFPSLTAVDGLNFLEYSFDKRYRHTNTLQTDGGPEFKAE